MVQRWRMECVGVPRPHKTSIVPSNPAIIERLSAGSDRVQWQGMLFQWAGVIIVAWGLAD